MPCTKGSGPAVDDRKIRLFVYFRDDGKARTLSCTYTRAQAALRLKWARHLENFVGHRTEAA